MIDSIQGGTLLHRLLQAASAEPLPLAILRERMTRRHPTPAPHMHDMAYRLRRHGWLRAERDPLDSRRYLYALTPKAEAELGRLYEDEYL